MNQKNVTCDFQSWPNYNLSPVYIITLNTTKMSEMMVYMYTHAHLTRPFCDFSLQCELIDAFISLSLEQALS